MSDKNIVLSSTDYEVLRRLVTQLEKNGKVAQPHFARLAREVKAAIVLDEQDLPDKVVTMGSRINYTFTQTGETSEVTLVFPAQAKDGDEYLSILAPLGLALIGEHEDTDVEYVAPGGTFGIHINSVEHTDITRAEAGA